MPLWQPAGLKRSMKACIYGNRGAVPLSWFCEILPGSAQDVNLRAKNFTPQRAIVKRSPESVRLLQASRVSWLARALVLSSLLALAACGRGHHRVLEVAYVSAPQATLRDQVAAIYNRVATVKNGERLEILDREKRFARVRTASGIEGWIEQRYLVDQKTYDGLQALTKENANAPVQAPGVLRNDTNLHITPGRDTEHLYQLASGSKVSLLKRGTAEKPGSSAPTTKLI